MYVATCMMTSYIATMFYTCRNELISSTWLEDPDDRPIFATIVQNLSIICHLGETLTNDESCIKDTNDTAESNDHVN